MCSGGVEDIPIIHTDSTHRQSMDDCRLAAEFFLVGCYDRAILLYSKALEKNRCDSRLWANRGTCFVRLRLFHQGIMDYSESIHLSPHCGELYYSRGVAYSGLKQFDLAIADYSTCLLLIPDYADALNNRGNAYRILKQYQLAQQDLDQAVRLQPQSQLYRQNQARINRAMMLTATNNNNNNNNLQKRLRLVELCGVVRAEECSLLDSCPSVPSPDSTLLPPSTKRVRFSPRLKTPLLFHSELYDDENPSLQTETQLTDGKTAKRQQTLITTTETAETADTAEQQNDPPITENGRESKNKQS